MPNIRFNHVFAGLLVVSFLSAFVLPARSTAGIQAHLQGLFAWVSRPVHRLAGSVAERWEARREEDARSEEGIRRENDALRVAVVHLEGQLQALRRVNAERDRVGAAREWSVPAEVTGADSGGRDSLSLAVTSRDGVQAEQVVVYPGGVVGKVQRAGLGGSQVRLVTDSGFRLLVSFGRYRESGNRLDFVRVDLPPQLIQGVGGGAMMVPNLTEKAVKEAGLAVGDWAMVADGEWPMNVQGYRVARVVEIRPAKAALFVDVRLEPETNLMGLREVMVMTK